MSYYLFHVTNDDDTAKVYKFDTDNFYQIFKYIIKKWGKNYFDFIKYTEKDVLLSKPIPKSILDFIYPKTDEICMIDMMHKIDIQDILKLFHVRFFVSKVFQMSSDENSYNILINKIYNMDYIYLQKLEVKDDDDVLSLHCEYDLEDNCRCKSLKFKDLEEYCNSTYFDFEDFDIVYPISDIKTISLQCSNTDPDIEERIQAIEKFQNFLTVYECNHTLEFEFY